MAKAITEKSTKPFGEVISATITRLVAEAWSENIAGNHPSKFQPAFGSFLKVDASQDKISILAVVYDVVTSAIDNNHCPVPLGLSRDELRAQQPHIFSLLKTQILALVIGFIDLNGQFYNYLPHRPAQVHDFVYPAASEEVIAVSQAMDFLHLLASITEVPADELLAACLRNANLARGHDEAFLVDAGRALAHLFHDDYDRLIITLKKLRA